jgi:SAM-dependent methyltransferase
MERKAHWDQIHAAKPQTELSWYRPHVERSLELVDLAGMPRSAEIIDVGGGVSTLVDDLLARGYEHLTVLDVSYVALGQARGRLGKSADKVSWISGDITTLELPVAHYDLWHDRALFHFLTEKSDRDRYVNSLLAALKPGGRVILAAFAPDGPRRCSGLDVVRYSAKELWCHLGNDFQLLRSIDELHMTPSGSPQKFVYALFKKRSGT